MKDQTSDSSSGAARHQQPRFYTGPARVYGIPGYVMTEVIYASQARAVDVIIQRGYALNNPSMKVICKGSSQMDEVANRRIEHEYDTLKFLYSKCTSAKDARASETFSCAQTHSYIPRPIEIVKDRGVLTLVIEDVGGVSLRKYQELNHTNNMSKSSLESTETDEKANKRMISLEIILNIALQIVEALKLTITAGVIHKDINPDNIVVVSLPGDEIAVQLIDFNLAAVVVSSDSACPEANVLQGTMAYMAPEQTGRLQRQADFRADFYSLGMTLWEVLVGRPAFHFTDVMDYMHAHLAIEIEAPSKVDSTIPEPISVIVQKLVRKSPESRYQSVYGLKYDLSYCLKIITQYKKSKGIASDTILSDKDVATAFVEAPSFEIATKDCSKTIQILKGKLYGRSTEQELLLDYVQKLLGCTCDKMNFILIVGERGMGNNSLLAVARSKILETNNFCVTGAYSEGCLPLQGILQALQQFIGMMLSSQTETLEYYSTKLKSSLGPEISRLESVLPDLRLLFGNASNVEDSSRAAVYPEMVADVTSFLKAVISCEKAFVLCLKDIETADADTFRVLAILAGCNTRCLVILTSSEPDSVSPIVAKSLQCVLDHQKDMFHYIHLKPLTVMDIQELLEDTVTPSLSPIHNLAALIERKTFGTPAYIHQFLFKAEAKGLLWFDEDEAECGWNWDIISLDKNIEVSDSVLKDMTKRVNSLSKDLKEVLENAVCIGQTFDVRLLSLLLHQRTAQVTNQLWDFLKAGFIKPIPFSESKGIWKDTSLDDLVANHPVGAVIEYNFAFESVYQEIYNSLSASSRENIHFKIARLIYAVASSKNLAGTEIEICKHYNLAIGKVSDHKERKLISSLNLQAAELAMSDFDFDHSKTFLSNGIKILKDMGDPWSHSGHLFFNLNLQMAKCLIVDGALDEAKALLNVIEAHSQAKSNIYKVYYLQRHLDAMFGDFSVVLKEGRSNLNDLGIAIPSNIEECKTLAEDLFDDIERRIKNMTPQELINASKGADEESDMIQVIMLIVAFAAYRSSTRAMFALLIAMGCHKSLTDGFCRSSCALWMAYPSLSYYLRNCPVKMSIEFARKMTECIIQQFPEKSQEFEVVFKLFCGHTLQNTFEEQTEMMEASIQNARHSGHNLTLNILSLFLVTNGFTFGKSISWVRNQMAAYREVLEIVHSLSVPVMDVLMQRVDSLVSGQQTDVIMNDEFISVFDLTICLIYERPDLKQRIAQIRGYSRCLPIGKLMDILFVEAIDLTNEYYAAIEGQDSVKTKLSSILEILKRISSLGYRDSIGKKYFACAEYARVFGNSMEAISQYEAAIQEFKLNGTLLWEAYALERFAAFWHGIGMKKMAQMSFVESAKKWNEYGSEGKRVQVVSKFKSLYGVQDVADFDNVRQGGSSSLDPGFAYNVARKGSVSPSNSSNSRSFCHSSRFGDSQTTGTVNLDMDATTALKVAQSIREETSLDSLLRKIMRYVMVNTGATKGALILSDNSRLTIEATAEFSDSHEIIDVLQSHPIANQVPGFRLPLSVIYYAFRTRKSIVLTDPANDATHGGDVYIKEFGPQSMLCCPIINQSTVTGVVYLENNLQGAAFTPKRIEVIQSLMPTASIYIKNAKLTKTNTELTEALKDSGAASNIPKYKIDAPVQRAIDILQSLKGRMVAQGDPAVRQIDYIMMSLTSSDLFMSSIDEINDEHGRGIDQDTKNWIENSLLQKSSKPSKGTEHEGDAMFIVGNRRATIVSVPEGGEGSRESLAVSQSSPRQVPRAIVQNQEEINVFLEGSMDFDFDVFRLGELTNGQPLCFLSMHLLQYYGLIEYFNIDVEVAKSFFREVEANYRNLSYHNSYHAADVLQTVNLLLLSDPQMAQNFTKLEILAACIASAVHDVDHPGVNNNYLIQSSHPLAILYNDLSVLEYHHASKAFEIMQKPQTNIFAKFPADQKRDVRKQMINMVIATDMSQHFMYINKLKSKISAAALKLQEAPDRALVLDMAIKCADLNNPAKSLESCKSWAFRIMEEFFQQGDRERMNGLNVSMFMDRKDTNIPKCQIGFIDILVAPLFESWSQCIATDFTRICMKNIALNRSHWESILDKPEAIPAFQPPDMQLLEQELFETVGSPATLKKKLISMQKNGDAISDSIRTKSKSGSVGSKSVRTSPASSKNPVLPLQKSYAKPPLRSEAKPSFSATTINSKTHNDLMKLESKSFNGPITPIMGRRTSAIVEMINPTKRSSLNLPELPKSDPAHNYSNVE